MAHPVKKSPLLWSPEFHCHVHWSLTLAPVLNQAKLLPYTSYVVNMNANIVLPPVPGSLKLPLSSSVPRKFNCSPVYHMSGPSHPFYWDELLFDAVKKWPHIMPLPLSIQPSCVFTFKLSAFLYSYI